MENRYGDIGRGQVRGRREIVRLREQQDNVAGGICMVREGGKGTEVSTCIEKKNTLRIGWRRVWTTYRCGPLPSGGAGPA